MFSINQQSVSQILSKLVNATLDSTYARLSVLSVNFAQVLLNPTTSENTPQTHPNYLIIIVS